MKTARPFFLLAALFVALAAAFGATTRFPDDVDIEGNLNVRGSLPTYPRASLLQEDFAPHAVPVAELRIWDAVQTPITTPVSDDLGLTAGTWGTGTTYVTAGDLKAAGATTRRLRFRYQLPQEYVAGQSVRIRFPSGMVTTAADGSCTIDCEAFKEARTTLVTGSDLVGTAAQSINSTTFANKDFDLTATTLSPGDWLDVRVSITCTDSATVTAVIPATLPPELLLDIKG